MTAEEMKAAESGAQSAPLPLEGVDIGPKQDEGVLKVRGGGAGAHSSRPSVELGSPGPSLQRPGGSLSRVCGRRPLASPFWTRLRCSGVGGPPHAHRGWPRCAGLPTAILWPSGEPAVRVRPRPPSPCGARARDCSANSGVRGAARREGRGRTAALELQLGGPGQRAPRQGPARARSFSGPDAAPLSLNLSPTPRPRPGRLRLGRRPQPGSPWPPSPAVLRDLGSPGQLNIS